MEARREEIMTEAATTSETPSTASRTIIITIDA
jgi:hypothetical protein